MVFNINTVYINFDSIVYYSILSCEVIKKRKYLYFLLYFNAFLLVYISRNSAFAYK